MTVPSIHTPSLSGSPVPLKEPAFAPAYLPTIQGAEAHGIKRLRDLFDRCPYTGTADEMVPVLLAVAGEAIAVVIEDLNMRGYLHAPPFAIADIMERVPIAVLNAVTIALSPQKK